jgi:hypothetical protein
MATIRARRQADGSTRYTAIVRIRKRKTVIHQEYKTVAHRAAAVTWAKHREVVLEDPSALIRVQHGASTLGELIRWYIDRFETISSGAVLNSLGNGGDLSERAWLRCFFVLCSKVGRLQYTNHRRMQCPKLWQLTARRLGRNAKPLGGEWQVNLLPTIELGVVA